jgi:IS30 family transposase
MTRHLSPEVRAQIVALRNHGATIYKIAAQLRIHPSTVSRTCKHYSKTRSFYSNNARAGRPRKLNQADARFAALQMART